MMQQQYINQVDLKEMQKPLSHHGSSSSDRCRYFFPLVYRYGPLQIYEDFSLFEQNALQCLLPAARPRLWAAAVNVVKQQRARKNNHYRFFVD